MAASLTLSILEIILLMFGAIILGITIHFFLASRKSLNATTEEMMGNPHSRDEWKLRYFDDMDKRDKELAALKSQVLDAQENLNIYSIEAEELRRTNKRLESEIRNATPPDSSHTDQLQKELLQIRSQLKSSEENNQLYSEELKSLRAEIRQRPQSPAPSIQQASSADEKELTALRETVQRLQLQVNTLSDERAALQKANRRLENEIEVLQDTVESPSPAHDRDSYLEQLQDARNGLIEQNHKINQLLSNIDLVKEKEEMQRDILRTNEELSHQVDSMRIQLTEKEREIENTRQQQLLAKEMTSMLDSAYNEFNVLQDKISKLENQLNSSRMANIEFEDLREEHAKLSRDYDAQKQKASALEVQCRELRESLADTEDQLKDTGFQKQQLQKKVAYLEELNRDMLIVSEANSKLEMQLRRVGELESRLNVVSAERDQLLQQSRD